MLSQTERQFFREQGYLFVRNILDEKMLEEVRKVALEEFAAANDPNRRGKWDIPEDGDKAVYRLSKMLDRHQIFRSIAMHPKVKGTLNSLLGPEVEVCTNRHNMLIGKQPHVGTEFPWHQDGFSWGHNNIVTLMLLIDKATTQNGCLEIIPGVHRNGYFANFPEGEWSWCMDTTDADVKDVVNQSVPLEGNPGDGIFFHSLTPHHSNPNTSDKERRSLSFAYVARRDKWMYNPNKHPIESIEISASPSPDSSRIRGSVSAHGKRPPTASASRIIR